METPQTQHDPHHVMPAQAGIHDLPYLPQPLNVITSSVGWVSAALPITYSSAGTQCQKTSFPGWSLRPCRTCENQHCIPGNLIDLVRLAVTALRLRERYPGTIAC
jgi:hypothetical protein